MQLGFNFYYAADCRDGERGRSIQFKALGGNGALVISPSPLVPTSVMTDYKMMWLLLIQVNILIFKLESISITDLSCHYMSVQHNESQNGK